MWPDSMGALFYLQANSRVEERFSSTKMRREENRRRNSVEHLRGGSRWHSELVGEVSRTTTEREDLVPVPKSRPADRRCSDCGQITRQSLSCVTKVSRPR
jgi:hypothetical protein